MSGPRYSAGPTARAGPDRASHSAYLSQATRPRTLPLLLLCAGLIVYLVWPFALERAGRAPWRFVSASPAPGEVLAATPTAVTVRLSDALAPNSRLRVERGTLTAVGGRPAYVGRGRHAVRAGADGGPAPDPAAPRGVMRVTGFPPQAVERRNHGLPHARDFVPVIYLLG